MDKPPSLQGFIYARTETSAFIFGKVNCERLPCTSMRYRHIKCKNPRRSMCKVTCVRVDVSSDGTARQTRMRASDSNATSPPRLGQLLLGEAMLLVPKLLDALRASD